MEVTRKVAYSLEIYRIFGKFQKKLMDDLYLVLSLDAFSDLRANAGLPGPQQAAEPAV